MNTHQIERVAERMSRSAHCVVFTGAGISVESGIPPFRGADGLWSRYDPACLDISFFHNHPRDAWKAIREIFYDFMGRAEPNRAHQGIARLEQMDIVKSVITQNIDNLHQQAGSRVVCEYHGTTRTLSCTGCGRTIEAIKADLTTLPPGCADCGGVMKPDFVFFGEPIPEQAAQFSREEAGRADCMLIIGTTGEVMPASLLPPLAKDNGCFMVEINTEPSAYTKDITDVFLQGTATDMVSALVDAVERGKETLPGP
ncbi:SIR2 family NAD-dependent protein deacylase [Desulfoplanes formicivorans]|uniref:protein acetyllysine N-acetyltransferase n=1 Tax=Desulfoplanes formicivorans TaxID=1592317 RepID=A0A194ALB9_9BACT|nr:NAD-dependent deacylase [Desulfoplanes formicivorans]GAU09469.1 sigma factor [Desulfoplanes formicivorans]